MVKTLEQVNQNAINALTEYCGNGTFADDIGSTWYGFGVEARWQAVWVENILTRCMFVECYEFDRGYEGVYTWISGRDCDGVKYGHCTFIRCTNYDDWYKKYSDAMEWVDGPEHWSFIPLDEVEDAKDSAYSIDTFAEAAGY